MKVLLNQSNGVLSKKRDTTININIKQTQDEIKHLRLFDTLDQHRVYEEEKKHCKRYRPIITIKPYCTNILFNPISEFVYKEGSQEQVVFTDTPNSLPDEIKSKVFGKKDGLDRQYLIQNTEYSHKNVGISYHIGYDFLNNHILRNKTNKSVCPPKVKGQDSERFNTITDVMRLNNGTVHRFRNRFSNSVVAEGGRVITNSDQEKHLYDINDLLRYSTDELPTLIKKENGWFGIKNNPTVKTLSNLTDTEFNRVLNDREGCTFADFYPDRSLFSFTPKFNDYKDRYEHNWEYFFGFPYREIDNHDLVYDGDFNTLRIASIKIERISKGYYVLKVYTELNNNLKNGDTIDLFAKTGRGTNMLSEDLSVSKTLKDNSFYVDSIESIHQFIPDHMDVNNLSQSDIDECNDSLSFINFRFRRKYNNRSVRYYIKTLKRIANDEFKKKEYTIGEDISEYYETYCLDRNGKLADFGRRTYDLGFSQTLFGDNVSQIYFTDELNLEYITDKKGKPITSFYFGIIKTNKGNKEWYNGEFDNDTIEYSHAFGDVSSCVHTNTPLSQIKRLPSNYDYRLINNLNLYRSFGLENDITIEGGFEKNEFMYCVCEYSPEEQVETVLSNIQYRFNTKQRELGKDRANGLFKKYIFNDIKKDDMDFGGFEIDTFDLTYDTSTYDGKSISITDRPEGYYYKPFYEIKIAEWSKPTTIYNQTMVIKELATDGHTIKLKTQHIHKLRNGMLIEVFDYNNHKDFVRLMVTDVYDLNYFGCKLLDNTKGHLIVKDNLYTILSPKIPYYADRIKYNTFVFSNINYYENKDTHYKNIRNYVNLNINFFLRRQDDGSEIGGLYAQADIPPREKRTYDSIGQDINLDDYEC